MPPVIAELFGCAAEPWIVYCRLKGSRREMACSSYATEKQARERVRDLNECFCGQRHYRTARRNA